MLINVMKMKATRTVAGMVTCTKKRNRGQQGRVERRPEQRKTNPSKSLNELEGNEDAVHPSDRPDMSGVAETVYSKSRGGRESAEERRRRGRGGGGDERDGSGEDALERRQGIRHHLNRSEKRVLGRDVDRVSSSECSDISSLEKGKTDQLSIRRVDASNAP